MIGSLSSVLRGHQKARKPRGWNPPPPGAVGIVESPVLIGLKNAYLFSSLTFTMRYILIFLAAPLEKKSFDHLYSTGN